MEYFELGETTDPDQADPLIEENKSDEAPISTDESDSLADTDSIRSNFTAENEEDPALQTKADHASVAEDTAYAASEQTAVNGTDREEKPPEQVNQETE